MKKCFLAWLILAVLQLSEGSAAAQMSTVTANSGCISKIGTIECDLILGDSLYSISDAAEHVVLRNNSGRSIQINQVQAVVETLPFSWSEYCVSRSNSLMEQSVGAPGTGEVGCTFRKSGELYSPIKWSTPLAGWGLAIAPGDTISINARVSPGFMKHRFVVTTETQSQGVFAFRIPAQDEHILCNGVLQSTPWTPWTNTTRLEMYLGGATILYGQSAPGLNYADAACIYVLRADQSIKWTFCDQVNKQGWISFPIQKILPGESVSAQSIKSCSPGGTSDNPNFWNWAAFLHVWKAPLTG